MMKKCLLCGTEEADWKRETCRACGEATWERFALIQDENGQMVKAEDRLDLVDALLKRESETPSEPAAPVKRGPGRPRKNP